MKISKVLFIGIILFLNINLFSNTVSSIFRIVKKIHLEGNGGWDYLTADDSTGRLFISHSNSVQVVDEISGNLIGTIPDTKGVHGIALAHSLNKGFISNGKDSSITIFNLNDLKVIEKVKVTGRNPDAILYDPFSKRVFTFNGGSSNATVIDAITNKVIETIILEGKPEFSVSDGNGKIYVNIEDKSILDEIDPVTLKIVHSWPIAPGEEASGLALDNKNHRLFVVCDNKLMIIIDALKGNVISTLPIGDRVDGVAFDPVKNYAYSSNGEGTMTVVSEENKDTFKVIENVVTQKGARTITVDKKTHHIFMPTAEFEAAQEPTNENPRPRPSIVPNSFVILDFEPIN